MKFVFKACLLSLLLVIIVLPLLAHAEKVPQPRVWDQTYPFSKPVQIDNFTIIYNQEKVGKIPDLVESVLFSYGNIDRYFDEHMKSSFIQNSFVSNSYMFRTTIEIAADNNEFRLLTGVGNIPDDRKALNWNEGVNGLVIIKSPDILPDFRQVLTYQLTRIAERTIMTKYRSMPEWYLDGTATYIAGNVTEDKQNAAMAAATRGTWMSLSDLEAAYGNMTVYNEDEPYYYNARAQSAILVNNIAQTYGNSNLIGILNDYTDNGNLTRAFMNHTGGHDPESINADLMKKLADKQVSVPSPEQKGGVYGYLNGGNGTPIGGQLISFSGAGTVTNVITGESGSYSMSLTPATYRISVPGQRMSGSDIVTVKAGEAVQRNVTLQVPLPAGASSSTIKPGDLVIPGLVAAVNLIALVALLAVLRRNWH
jgi:hypothetical protein